MDLFSTAPNASIYVLELVWRSSKASREMIRLWKQRGGNHRSLSEDPQTPKRGFTAGCPIHLILRECMCFTFVSEQDTHLNSRICVLK